MRFLGTPAIKVNIERKTTLSQTCVGFEPITGEDHYLYYTLHYTGQLSCFRTRRMWNRNRERYSVVQKQIETHVVHSTCIPTKSNAENLEANIFLFSWGYGTREIMQLEWKAGKLRSYMTWLKFPFNRWQMGLAGLEVITNTWDMGTNERSKQSKYVFTVEEGNPPKLSLYNWILMWTIYSVHFPHTQTVQQHSLCMH